METTALIPAMHTPSAPSTLAFVLIVAGLCGLLVLGTAHASRALGDAPARTRRVTLQVALGALAWLAITGAASASGVLRTQMLPPPLMLFMVGSLGAAIALAFSPVGTRLVQGAPVAALVAAQAFRLPLELVLHTWSAQGVVPVQMTFEGRNLDIVTGLLAVVIGAMLALRPPSRALVWFFNCIGSALLLNVATIAVLSSPLPVRRFLNDPPLLLAYYYPYGYIVPFCVGGALFLHVTTFRWLAQHARTARTLPAAPYA